MANKTNFPNIMLFVKLIILIFMLFAYFLIGETASGIVYIFSGAIMLSSIYVYYRGITLNSIQYNINLICDAVLNVVAFGILVLSGIFGIVYLMVFMVLELVQTMLSSMLILGDYDAFRKQKAYVVFSLVTFLGICLCFFGEYQTLKIVVLSIIFACYVADIALKAVSYFNLPIAKQNIIEIVKEETLEEKIEENDKDIQIAE